MPFAERSPLLEKSELNFQAASAMKTTPFLAASVHCCYYSCFQMIKHYLEYELDPPESLSRTGDAHDEARSKMTHHLGRVNPAAGMAFQRDISTLRTFRLRSDYDNVMVSENEVKQAFALAQSIRGSLTGNLP